jgi:hypothetical protein
MRIDVGYNRHKHNALPGCSIRGIGQAGVDSPASTAWHTGAVRVNLR